MLTIVFNDLHNNNLCWLFPEKAYLVQFFDKFLWEYISLNCRKGTIPSLTAVVFKCSPNTVHFPDVC